MFCKKILFVSAVLVFCISACGKREADLRWRFRQGEVLRYRLEMKSEGGLSLGAIAGVEALSSEEISMGLELSLLSRFCVEKVGPDGTATLLLNLEGGEARITSGEETFNISLDSDFPGHTGWEEGSFRGLLEKPVRFRMDTSGRVLGKGDEESPFATLLREPLLSLPGRSVRAGNTWESERNIFFPFFPERDALSMKVRCVFRGVERIEGRRLARIALEGSGEWVGREGDLKGECLFDIVGGRLIRETVEMGQRTTEGAKAGLTLRMEFSLVRDNESG